MASRTAREALAWTAALFLLLATICSAPRPARGFDLASCLSGETKDASYVAPAATLTCDDLNVTGKAAGWGFFFSFLLFFRMGFYAMDHLAAVVVVSRDPPARRRVDR